jgi:hypothetical protein
VRSIGDWTALPRDRTASTLRLLLSKGKSLFNIQAIYPFVVDRPPFAAEQHVQPTITVADTDGGDLPNPPPERFLSRPAGSVTDGGEGHSGDATGPTLGYLIRILYPLHPHPSLRRPQNFLVHPALPGNAALIFRKKYSLSRKP